MISDNRQPATDNKQRVLFSWSGGGFPGLDIHLGMWKALDEFGIRSTVNAGTSAGAIVAAFNSTGRNPGMIETILRGLSDSAIRRKLWFWKLRLFWIDHILDPRPVSRLLENLLPTRFDGLAKPLHVFATDESTGRSLDIDSGHLTSALLASMSISGIFPPVLDRFSDGGTTANIPLPRGWEDSFDDVYLLIAARPYKHRGHGIIGRFLNNMDLVLEDQVQDTIALAQSHHPRIHVIRPVLDAPHGSLRFDHDLINQSYQITRQIVLNSSTFSTPCAMRHAPRPSSPGGRS